MNGNLPAKAHLLGKKPARTYAPDTRRVTASVTVSVTAPATASVTAPESADAVLAKNLLVARVVAGITQKALANAAGISRATIAQLETGYSDPRLSTIVELATALGVPPILLLLGKPEALALAAFFEHPSLEISLSATDIAHMRRLIDTGMLKDRLRAALVGASAARASGEEGSVAPVSAAIFSAIYPGPGTVAGTLLGKLLSEKHPS